MTAARACENGTGLNGTRATSETDIDGSSKLRTKHPTIFFAGSYAAELNTGLIILHRLVRTLRALVKVFKLIKCQLVLAAML